MSSTQSEPSLSVPSAERRRLRTLLTRSIAAVAVVASTLSIGVTNAAAASTVTRTFSYTGSTQTFTVPAGVSTLNVTLTGAQGGRGGYDSQGAPIPGGYRGVVSGTIDVTPGQVLTVAVGGGGGTGVSSKGSAAGGSAGLNPLDGYDGAVGGTAGPEGSSGGGGGGGAATVLRVGATDLVAAGAGGGGGNGQFEAIVGRRAEENHVARSDATSSSGRPGRNTAEACSVGYRCDGGASGAGGGGAQGGERGDVQYGGASATEYFGFGGYPGSNSVAGLAGLSAYNEYYAGNSANGSLTITYDDGTPGAPRSLSAAPANGAVELDWLAPSTTGSAPITDYVVQYATSVGGTYTTFPDGVSTTTRTRVTGLTNGTTYWFRVAAVNEVGTGPSSSAMAQGVTPSDVPDAPTIALVTPLDGSLRVEVTPGHTDSPVTSWEYSVDDGAWQVANASGAELTIGGLRNGTSYSVAVRARNAVGASAASSPSSGTPRAVPGAPSGLVANPADGAVSLTWSAPGTDNGSPVSDFVVQRAPSAGGPWSTVDDGVSTATSTSVAGLANGTTVHFRVAAVNAAGIGAFSSTASATPYTTPSAVVLSSLEAADGSLVVHLGSSGDGGSPVVRYEFRLDASGPWISTGGPSQPFTVGGLVNGTPTAVEVRAVNAAGSGPASAPLVGTPRSVPAAPAISTVALDTGAVQVSFSLGADGGSPLTNLQYSIDDGATWQTRSPASTSSPLTISGLVGGRTYPIRLRGVNAVGAGASSNTSSVTAKGTPEAPTIVMLTPGDRSLVAEVVAGPNGGSAITGFEVSVDGGATWSPRASSATTIVVTGLLNGASYGVRVRGVNAAGSGAASDVLDATPRTVPGAPEIVGGTVSGTGGDMDVDFIPPVDDGGAPVVTYEYSTDAGTTWRTREAGTTFAPLRITHLSSDGTTPLVGGRTYPVEIRALNAAGAGAASGVAAGTTTTVPDAPRIDAVDVAGTSARVTFHPPANGGSAISSYEIRVDGGAWLDTGSTATEVLLTDLSVSHTYSIEVRARNGVGSGEPSAPAGVTIRYTPDAPTVTAVTAGDRSLSVAFVPGADNGAPITTYEYSTDGGITWRTRATGSDGSPLVITTTSGLGSPLVNGHLYTVQIRARSSVGAGAASGSTLVAPLGAPDAPTGVTVTGADRSLVVSFVPGGDGGSAVTRVEYRLDGGPWVDSGSLTSPFTIGGLLNGVSHDVEVRSVSALGDGRASDPATGVPRTTPGAPSEVTATPADRSVNVSWSAPTDDGGAAISGYTVTLFDAPVGGVVLGSCTTSGALTCSVGGLSNGKAHHVAVVATNAAGSGPASAPRAQVRPVGRPVVSIGAVVPGTTSLAVAVSTDDGGAPLSAYEYRLDGGAWVSTGTASQPFTIPGLTTGRSYSIEVRGVNAVGAGDPSPAVSATPRTLPGAPTTLRAASGPRSAVLTWSAPLDNGGAAITDYLVQYATSVVGPFTDVADGVSATTGAVVGDLTDGTGYVFRVAAVNAAGTGPWSPLASTTPLSPPGAPNLTGLTVGSQFVQAAFTAPSSTGGSPVTGYQYQLDGGDWRNASGTTSPLLIPGLTNGHAYMVAIRAVNVVGGGTSSNTRSATPYGLPSAVPGFLASPTSNAVTLTWDAANPNGSAVSNYHVIRWSAATEGSIVASYDTAATTFTVSGLSSGTYFFTVEATNAAGTGPRSAPRTSAVVGGTTPAAPSIGAVTVVDGAASISWTNGAPGSSPISGYVIRSSDGSASTTLAHSGTAGSSATVALSSTASPYSLQVASISAAGVGAFSSVRPALVGAATASAVAVTSATVGGTANANGAVADVVVEYATERSSLGSGSASTVAVPGVSGSTDVAVSAAITGLAPGTTYHARIRATVGGSVTYGSTTTFTTSASVVSSGLDKSYDGLPIAPSTSTSPAGLTVTRSFLGTGSTSYPATATPPSQVGTYRMTTTASGPGVGGTEVVDVAITARELTLTVVAADRTWDGTSHVDIVATLVGSVPGDDVEVARGSILGVLRDAHAGTSRVVDLSTDGPVLTGADAANYTVTVPVTTAVDIAKVPQVLRFVTTVPERFDVGERYRPVAESDLGRTVTLELLDTGGTPTACRMEHGEVVAMGEGVCTVVATQGGDADVAAASTIGQVLVVSTPVPPTTVPPTTVPPKHPSTTVPPTTVPAGNRRSTPAIPSNRAGDLRLSSGDDASSIPVGSFGDGTARSEGGSAEQDPSAAAGSAPPAESVGEPAGGGGVASGPDHRADDPRTGGTPGLGTAVASSERDRAGDSNPFTVMASVASRHPVAGGVGAVLLLACLGGAWLLVARRRRADES